MHVFLQENGYQVLFLSARAISQAYHTRQFLRNLKQVMHKELIITFIFGLRNAIGETIHVLFIEFSVLYLQDGKALPDGPMVISPDGLFPSLYREGSVKELFIYSLVNISSIILDIQHFFIFWLLIPLKLIMLGLVHPLLFPQLLEGLLRSSRLHA